MSPKDHLLNVHRSAGQHHENCASCHMDLSAQHKALADHLSTTSPIESKIHAKVAEAHLAAAAENASMAERHRAWARELAPTEKTAGQHFDLLKVLSSEETQP